MHGTSKWMIKLAIFVTAIALATPALAGVVMFKGKVRTGFGTSTNVTDAANNALPACAPLNGNVYAPNTWGTLQAQGFAEQGTGTHPTLMFDAYEALSMDLQIEAVRDLWHFLDKVRTYYVEGTLVF